MSGHGEKLSRNKEKAISALLLNPSLPEAAKAVGIGESTLRRWLNNKDFAEAYRKARAEVVRHATVQVQAVMGKAVQTLDDVMSDPGNPPSSRVSAAKAVLDLGVKAWELEEIETRLAALERIVSEKNR